MKVKDLEEMFKSVAECISDRGKQLEQLHKLIGDSGETEPLSAKRAKGLKRHFRSLKKLRRREKDLTREIEELLFKEEAKAELKPTTT